MKEAALECGICGRIYPIIDGVIDFIPEYDQIRRPGTAQRFMENMAMALLFACRKNASP